MQFDKVNYIHKIIIYSYFYTDWYKDAGCTCCTGTIENYYNCIKNHNTLVDVEVYKQDTLMKQCGTWSTTNGLTQEEQTYTFICDIEGDSIKLISTPGNSVFIIINEMVALSKGNN